MYFSILSTLALASSALAQSSSKVASAGSAKATGSSGMTTHRVMVSNNQGALTFTPSVVNAEVGQMVEFMFYPKNHSVAQAAFDSPCMPMAGAQGFFSGFMPVNGTMANNAAANSTKAGKASESGHSNKAGKAHATSELDPAASGSAKAAGNGTHHASKAAKVEMKTFSVMVKSSDPMWFYCSQGQHCQAGMVGVINPSNTSGQTIDMFAATAKKATSNVSPMKVAGGVMGAMKMKVDVEEDGAKDGSKENGANESTRSSGVARATGGRTKTTASGAARATGATRTSGVAVGTGLSRTSAGVVAATSTGNSTIKPSNDGSRPAPQAGSLLGLIALFAVGTALL